ncbi:hypothetical protein EDB85DRAFT_1892214 [Lactarius pseudohatsudake]|nr:hypothetical protein EDB85DRAFT_1892214 [Lactarius pseudohatsudake]
MGAPEQLAQEIHMIRAENVYKFVESGWLCGSEPLLDLSKFNPYECENKKPAADELVYNQLRTHSRMLPPLTLRRHPIVGQLHIIMSPIEILLDPKLGQPLAQLPVWYMGLATQCRVRLYVRGQGGRSIATTRADLRAAQNLVWVFSLYGNMPCLDWDRARLRVAQDFGDLTAVTSYLSLWGYAQVRSAGEHEEWAALSLTEPREFFSIVDVVNKIRALAMAVRIPEHSRILWSDFRSSGNKADHLACRYI